MRRYVRLDQRIVRVDMAFGVEMDQHLDFWKGAAQRRLDRFDHVVRLGHGDVARDLHVELREVVRAGMARAEVVDALDPRLAYRHLDEVAPLLLGPFAVHQLVDRARRRAERAPAEPPGDDDAEDRVGIVPPREPVEQECGDDRTVEQHVRLIMDVVRQDRDRSRPADDRALIPQQRHRREDRRDGDADAEPEMARRLVVAERQQRAPRDADRRGGDEHHLEQGGERLGLAVAETVVVIRRRRGEPHAVERDEAGEQVEPRIGEAAEHRDRPGGPRRPALQRDQSARHRHTGERGADGERHGPALFLGHG